MEHLIGYDRTILIDAFAAEDGLGSIRVMKLDDLPTYSAFHISSAHDTSLQNAIEMGRSLGAYLPEDITVVGIVTQRIYDFSEELSPPVAEAIPQTVKIVLDLLKQTTY
jgi:hydrogenase maturation protease